MDRRSFFVKPGMIVSIREKSRSMPVINQSLESGARDVPDYLALDAPKFAGQVLVAPGIDQIPLPLPVNVPLVCEFLAHTN
mgnify:CR=1 FL=1